MTDTYLAIANVADNDTMHRRVAAAAAQQSAAGNAFNWALEHRYAWAAAPGWGAAWESALVAHPEPDYDPGADEAVVTDGMILAQVQSMLSSPE